MKNIYVLTGATGGMGSDYARNFKEDGILIISDLNQAKLEALQTELKKQKIKSEICVCDVADPASVDHLVQFTKSLGKFKALIHMAGLPESNPNLELIYKVNLMGVKYLNDAFYEICDHSIIIHIASMMGHMVPDSKLYNKTLADPLNPKFYKKMKIFTQNKGTNAYAFAKKGVIMLVEREVGKFAKKNTRILSVSPGAVETPMSTTDASDTKVIDTFVKNTPIPRMAEPSETTSLLHYLCSDAAEFINGTDILIDGGITAHMKFNDIFKDQK